MRRSLSRIFPSLQIPYEIWNLILDFERNHPINDIMEQYIHSVSHSISSIYIIPFFFGLTQFILIGTLISGIDKTPLFGSLYPFANLPFLQLIGYILLSTASIQIIGDILSISINYTPSNLVQLSKLKQIFYQKGMNPAHFSSRHNFAGNKPISTRPRRHDSIFSDSVLRSNSMDFDVSELSRSDSLSRSLIIDEIDAMEAPRRRIAPRSIQRIRNDSSLQDHGSTQSASGSARCANTENRENTESGMSTMHRIHCNVEFKADSIEWRMWNNGAIPENERLSLMALQPWELLIPAQKWCNTLYTLNLLHLPPQPLVETLSISKSAIFQPNFLLILCKPIFVFLVGIQLLVTCGFMVLVWLLFWCTVCFFVWRAIFDVSFPASFCWSVIVCCLEIWQITTRLGAWWNTESLDKVMEAAFFSFAEIFVLIGAYSLVYLCQKTNRIILFGVWPAWVLTYVLTQVNGYLEEHRHEKQWVQCLLMGMSFYCLYVSMQFMLFCAGRDGDLKLFSKGRFILCTWLFGWFDVHLFRRWFHDPKLDLLPC